MDARKQLIRADDELNWGEGKQVGKERKILIQRYETVQTEARYKGSTSPVVCPHAVDEPPAQSRRRAALAGLRTRTQNQATASEWQTMGNK